jgi:hypothetical protein
VKGETDDETFIRRRPRNLERVIPEIIDTIATTAVNPVAGLKGCGIRLWSNPGRSKQRVKRRKILWEW